MKTENPSLALLEVRPLLHLADDRRVQDTARGWADRVQLVSSACPERPALATLQWKVPCAAGSVILVMRKGNRFLKLGSWTIAR